ncbi:MAG: hypothetical protein QOF52_648 [Propionibacteriaceae bacterium]|jgi:superfamily II DNA/RNA helicase|nr:hypothetical protein [Propionibacteriaceae bacterium]
MPERPTGASSRAFTASKGARKNASKKAPKSFKSDGTAKKRWSREERTERGLGARRSGGQPRNQGRSERYAAPERAPQVDRWERPEAADRTVRSYGSDRPARAERSSGSDRPARVERSYGSDRPARAERSYGSDRTERSYGSDRPARAERSYSSNRTERSYSSDRGYQGNNSGERGRSERNDRGAGTGGFADRAPRTERGDWNRSDRGQTADRGRFERTDRSNAHVNTSDTGAFRNGSSWERPQQAERRTSYGRSDSTEGRSSWGGRSEHRTDRRDDRRDNRGSNRGGYRPEHNHDEQDENGGSDTMSWTAQEIAPENLKEVSGENGFAALGLPEPLVAALQSQGITEPFPIQAATIPDALTGRDVLGRGQTGSGKTLGFGLPMLARLSGSHGKTPRGIVLVPTRELAMQVADVIAPLAKTVGMSVTLIAGGMSYTPQLRAFQRGVDIVVATPGRLIDLLEQGAVDLSKVEVAVLDEADHMADLGFMPAVTTLLDAVPEGGQRMLFSATLDRAVDRLVRRYLNNPVTHEVDSGQATVSTMEHHLLHVLPHDKNQLTAEIAGRQGRTVVFVRTQRGADRVAEQLRESGVMAGALHGGLTQGARSRIMAAFKDGNVPVLVATDVAARGIHVDEVGLVLQVDPPAGPKEYLHRAGRTARAGGTGVVVTLALPHQRKEVGRLASQAGVKSAPLEARPGDETLARVTGARQPSGVAVSTAEFERLIAPPSRGGGRPRNKKDFSRRDAGSRGFGGRGQGRSRY